jgi:glycosyltransferase involved in cell wall biosynthesis
MTWHLVTGEYPPACGGVGDYTAYLARALADAGDTVHVWTPRSFRLKAAATGSAADVPGSTVEVGRAIDGVKVHDLPDRFGPASRRRLAAAWRTTPGIVLLQYVPNALGARGANLPFCLWLRRIHRGGADVRVMFHEPYLYFSLARPWRNALALVQRMMAATLLRSATRVYLSTATWRRYLSAAGALPRIETLSIPSSLPATASRESIDRYRLEIAPDGAQVVGHFGTYGEHVAHELHALLPVLAERLPAIRFALAGAGSVEFLDRLRIQHPRLAARAWAAGHLDEGAVPAVLRACDLLVQPYPDGITTRRTSVMAGLKNGVATVSTSGFLTETVWTDSRAAALAPTRDAEAVAELVATLLGDPEARAALACRGAQAYRQHFSIEHTVAALRTAPAGAP